MNGSPIGLAGGREKTLWLRPGPEDQVRDPARPAHWSSASPGHFPMTGWKWGVVEWGDGAGGALVDPASFIDRRWPSKATGWQ